MHKVTLVCSSHRENGICNVGELLTILRAFEPDTIFEEIRESDFDANDKRTVESHAVTKYGELKSIQRVPVDRFDLPQDLFAETQKVFDFVERTSHEYLVLAEEIDNNAHLHGFTYLNSLAFESVRARMSQIEDKTINDTRDQGLIRGLEMWRAVMQRRETEMVGNIYKYCKEKAFCNGIFLVGAAHKSGIAKAIEKYASAEAGSVDWHFYR